MLFLGSSALPQKRARMVPNSPVGRYAAVGAPKNDASVRESGLAHGEICIILPKLTLGRLIPVSAADPAAPTFPIQSFFDTKPCTSSSGEAGANIANFADAAPDEEPKLRVV
jgi:hypothetical protein